jgi:hypothetical protein
MENLHEMCILPIEIYTSIEIIEIELSKYLLKVSEIKIVLFYYIVCF